MSWKDKFPKERRYWEMENGILYNGDVVNVLKTFPSESIDLVVTSPPYDNLRFYGTKNEKELLKMWNFKKFKQVAKELYRIMKQGGVVVWVVGDATINGSETGNSFRQALYFKDECGFNLHDTMIYEKTGFSAFSNVRYIQAFEFMFIFSKGKPKTFNAIKDRRNKWAGTYTFGNITKRQHDGSLKPVGKKKINEFSIRTNIWKIKNNYGFNTKDKIAHKHPAIFPEQLAHDHIISWSNEEDIVLDPLCGSGTTLKMAEKLNRRWIGIEINHEYCQIVKERIENVLEEKLFQPKPLF